jgi:broad specificity phosphatase PhoE
MLYLVRHGTTDQGLIRPPGDLTPATHEEWLQDHALNNAGQREARALRRRFAGMIAPDRVLVSPKRRTQETARAALPDAVFEQEQRLHEWHASEPEDALRERSLWLLSEADNAVVAAFTHGGFIRAVVAALLTRNDPARFGALFHDLRRTLHIWNGSLTIIGQGGTGLELIAVNLCDSIDQIAGLPREDPSD